VVGLVVDFGLRTRGIVLQVVTALVRRPSVKVRSRRRTRSQKRGRYALESDAYSIGRVEIPVGVRPARTQPMMPATTGIAIKMRNRLSHGTWLMMSDTPPSS
jgi:hypothetical protein